MPCDEELATCTCGALKSERLRYFTGRHMTARDFADEQLYQRSHRFFHNRMLHGWGIVCGLRVCRYPDPKYRDKCVVVRCGMAIDCCGRELLLRRDTTKSEIPWGERPQLEGGRGADPDTVLLLCLEYCEVEVERVPVLYNEKACTGTPMEYGRVREGARLAWHWVHRDELAENGWRVHAGCAPPHHKGEGEPRPNDCAPETETCCLDPVCPKQHCVPLAVLYVKPDGDLRIDVSGRRRLSDGESHLTHLCWTNWPHGGIVSPSWLRHHGRLLARFDRELEEVKQPKGSCGRRGVNPCTFVVQYGEIYEDLDFVPYERDPYLDDDRRTAVFKLEDPRPGVTGHYHYLIGHTVYVTIKCDFLLDCHGQAVDGNHVGGRLPTGNDTPGGTFESWFTVVSDQDYERLKADNDPRLQAESEYAAMEEQP
jgi:hypothetical protein